MKITQCVISESIKDFPFMNAYGLTEYVDSLAPCVFFGCYGEDDICNILEHKGLAIIVWCGQDSLDFKYWKLFKKPNIKHVSFMKNVAAHLNNYTGCISIKYKNLDPITPKPLKLGHKIYVYMPDGNEKYHGSEMLDSLNLFDYELIFGDGKYTQDEWRNGKSDEVYSKCFIGLVLSNYAGGGSTIVELGMRGIKCVTNVLDLPNVINWKSRSDIETAIKQEAKKIGKINKDLPIFVQRNLDNNNEFLNTEFYD